MHARRSLLGRRVFDLPLGYIRQRHLEAAKHVLSHFDAVMLLERPIEARTAAR